MYEVFYSKSSVKFLKKLPLRVKEHIISVVERARVRPLSYFERLVGDKCYKLRAGDYKVIADIDGSNIRILVVKIGHRKNIYK
jgi:mRNA interferase RelE/StbE